MLKPNLWTVAALIALAALSRLAPHWWNLTAVGAVCLFGGAYFQRKWLAFAVPLAALAASDLVLQTLVYRDTGLDYFSNYASYFNYLSFAATVPLGLLLAGRTRPLPLGVPAVTAAAVASAVLYFLLSNFCVWACGDGTGLRMYPLTPAGLLACYVAAIPFSWSTLYGNLLFSGLLFGGMEYYRSAVAQRTQTERLAA